MYSWPLHDTAFAVYSWSRVAQLGYSIFFFFFIHCCWHEFARAFGPITDNNLNLLIQEGYAHHQCTFIYFEYK
jgi:hypothetical protein